MINTILLVNDCEVIDKGFSGQAFTLAAGSKPSESDDAEISKKIEYDTGGFDYLVLTVKLESSDVLLKPGDMLLINDDLQFTAVCNPSPELTKSIIENSGLEVHNTKHQSYD